jgi:hypothetical protein
MALVVKDRVKVTSTTTGTGTFTLGSAVLGFQNFSVIGDGNTTYYTITGVGSSEFEVGIGTFTLSGTTLSRDTILESSNSGSAVNFSAGDKEVFVTYPAERAVYTDAAGTAITPATSSRLGFANLAQGSALSVLGVTGNATADNASIAAGTDHEVLRRSGTSVAFGAVNLAQSAAITGTLPVTNGGTGITSFGAGVATFLGTPSSANLAAAVTDETGSGSIGLCYKPYFSYTSTRYTFFWNAYKLHWASSYNWCNRHSSSCQRWYGRCRLNCKQRNYRQWHFGSSVCCPRFKWKCVDFKRNDLGIGGWWCNKGTEYYFCDGIWRIK